MCHFELHKILMFWCCLSLYRQTVTQVFYCVSVQPTAPVTAIDDVVRPSFGVMSNATSGLGITLVQPSGTLNASSNTLAVRHSNALDLDK